MGPGSHVLDNGHGEFSVRGAERTFSNYFDHMYLLRFNIFSQPVIFFEKKNIIEKTATKQGNCRTATLPPVVLGQNTLYNRQRWQRKQTSNKLVDSPFPKRHPFGAVHWT